MRHRLLFVTPSSDNFQDHRDHPHDDQARSCTPAIPFGTFYQVASSGTMRFTFSVLISIISSTKNWSTAESLEIREFRGSGFT